MTQRVFWAIFKLKKRTSLLFLVFMMISSLVLGGMILNKTITDGEKRVLSKTSGNVRIRSILQQGQYDDQTEICNDQLLEKVKATDEVESFGTDLSDSVSSHLKTFGEESNEDDLTFGDSKSSYKAPAHVAQSLDDPEFNGDFSSRISVLVKGRYPNKGGECLISQNIAEMNNIHLGDSITITTTDIVTNKQTDIKIKVTGFFSVKNEKKESNVIKSRNKLNYIYMPTEDLIKINKTYTKSGPIKGTQIPNISVKLKPGVSTEKFIQSLKKDGKDYSAISFVGTDSTRERLQESTKSVKDISKISIIGALIISFMVLALVIVMSFRERSKEFGILLSIGFSKLNVFVQSILEVLVLSVVACAVSIILLSPIFSQSSAKYMEHKIENVSTNKEENDQHVQHNTLPASNYDLSTIVVTSFIIVGTAVIFTSIPAIISFRKKSTKELLISK